MHFFHAFRIKFSDFFKVGRVFLNYKQLVAVGQYLLDAWAVSSSHEAKSLNCYYGAQYKKKPLGQTDPNRQAILSPKNLSCPFRVREFVEVGRVPMCSIVTSVC
jgi:hypothetical protein